MFVRVVMTSHYFTTSNLLLLLLLLDYVQTANVIGAYYGPSITCYQCENTQVTGTSTSSFFNSFGFQTDAQCGSDSPSSSSAASCPTDAQYSCAYITADISGSLPIFGSFNAKYQQRFCLKGSSSGCQTVDKSQLDILNGALKTLFNVHVNGEICTCTSSLCIAECDGVVILGTCIQIWMIGVACGGVALLLILFISCCCCCCCRSKRATPTPAYNTSPMYVVQQAPPTNYQQPQPPPTTWSHPQTNYQQPQWNAQANANVIPGGYPSPADMWNSPQMKETGNYKQSTAPPAYCMTPGPYEQQLTTVPSQTTGLPTYNLVAGSTQPAPEMSEMSEMKATNQFEISTPEMYSINTSQSNVAVENPMYHNE